MRNPTKRERVVSVGEPRVGIQMAICLNPNSSPNSLLRERAVNYISLSPRAYQRVWRGADASHVFALWQTQHQVRWGVYNGDTQWDWVEQDGGAQQNREDLGFVPQVEVAICGSLHLWKSSSRHKSLERSQVEDRSLVCRVGRNERQERWDKEGPGGGHSEEVGRTWLGRGAEIRLG